MSITHVALPRLAWVWLALSAVVALGIATRSHAAVALVIGIAAGLSLSGST